MLRTQGGRAGGQHLGLALHSLGKLALGGVHTAQTLQHGYRVQVVLATGRRRLPEAQRGGKVLLRLAQPPTLLAQGAQRDVHRRCTGVVGGAAVRSRVHAQRLLQQLLGLLRLALGQPQVGQIGQRRGHGRVLRPQHPPLQLQGLIQVLQGQGVPALAEQHNAQPVVRAGHVGVQLAQGLLLHRQSLGQPLQRAVQLAQAEVGVAQVVEDEAHARVLLAQCGPLNGQRLCVLVQGLGPLALVRVDIGHVGVRGGRGGVQLAQRGLQDAQGLLVVLQRLRMLALVVVHIGQTLVGEGQVLMGLLGKGCGLDALRPVHQLQRSGVLALRIAHAAQVAQRHGGARVLRAQHGCADGHRPLQQLCGLLVLTARRLHRAHAVVNIGRVGMMLPKGGAPQRQHTFAKMQRPVVVAQVAQRTGQIEQRRGVPRHGRWRSLWRSSSTTTSITTASDSAASSKTKRANPYDLPYVEFDRRLHVYAPRMLLTAEEAGRQDADGYGDKHSFLHLALPVYSDVQRSEYSRTNKLHKLDDYQERPWYKGQLQREEAEKLLREPNACPYLVRISPSQPSAFVLSWLFQGKIMHIKILNQEGQFLCDVTAGVLTKLCAPTLSALMAKAQERMRLADHYARKTKSSSSSRSNTPGPSPQRATPRSSGDHNHEPATRTPSSSQDAPQPLGVSGAFLRRFLSQHSVSKMTVHEVLERLVLPACHRRNCCYAELCSPTEVDEKGIPLIGPANVFVSYATHSSLSLTLEAVLADGQEEDDDGRPSYFYFDLFSSNLFAARGEPWYSEQCSQLLHSVKTALVVFSPAISPLALMDSACLFEMYCALRGEVGMRVCLAAQDRDALLAVLERPGQFDGLLQAFHNTDIAQAAAVSPDRAVLLQTLASCAGGVSAANALVREWIKKWAVETVLSLAHAACVDRGRTAPLHAFAAWMRDAGQPAHAMALNKTVLERLLQEDGPESLRVAGCMLQLGQCNMDVMEYDTAVEVFSTCLRIRLKLQGETQETGDAYHALGVSQQRSGDYQGALAALQSCLRVYKDCGADLSHVAAVHHNIGELHAKQKNLQEAEKEYRVCIELETKQLGDNHPTVAISKGNLGMLLSKLKQHDAAARMVQQALNTFLSVHGEDHPGTAVAYSQMGAILQAQGQVQQAVPHLEKSLLIRKRLHGPFHPDTASAHAALGTAYSLLQDVERALQHMRLCHQGCLATLGPDHPDTKAVLTCIAHFEKMRV
eukprot:m.268452 g.268452  ORF g.268452 m.268452 type:complete len:1228 (+) comp22810_c0_seq1:716-4399(+)